MTLVLDDDQSVVTVVADVEDTFKIEQDLDRLIKDTASDGPLAYLPPRDLRVSAFMKGGHYFISHVRKP